MITKDGRVVFIEFNFGTQDGTINALDAPLSANLYVSALQGKRTALLQDLHRVSRLPIEEQNRYLRNLESEITGRHLRYLIQEEGLYDYYIYAHIQFLTWFRDQHLERWNASGEKNHDTRVQVLRELCALFHGIRLKEIEEQGALQEGIDGLIQYADDYMRSEIR